MTPGDALTLATGFIVVLIGGAALLEETAAGRRFAERAVRWVLR